MDTKSIPTPSRAPEARTEAATAHLKESWEEGKKAASEARRIAGESWNDLSRNVGQYVESRPMTIALGALGAGLAVGFLTGLLVSRAGRASSASA